MIVPVRNWTLLRPVRLAWRAHKVNKTRTHEVREDRPIGGLLGDFEAMLSYTTDMVMRGHKVD